MHIGSNQTGGSAFTGLMDEVAIWDRSLSFQLGANNQVVGGDVHTIFTQGIPALGANNTGMIGYWPFDDTDDDFTAIDASGTGNDATLDGGAFKVDDDPAPGVGGSGRFAVGRDRLGERADHRTPRWRTCLFVLVQGRLGRLRSRI